MKIGVFDIITKSQMARFMMKIFDGVRSDFALQEQILKVRFGLCKFSKLRGKHPNDETVASERENGEGDVEQSKEIVEAGFGLLEAEPMFGNLFEVLGGDVPAEKPHLMVRCHSSLGSCIRKIAENLHAPLTLNFELYHNHFSLRILLFLPSSALLAD